MRAKRDFLSDVPGHVRHAFGLARLDGAVHPAGSDAQLWYATTEAGADVVLRYERWWPRPLEVLCAGTARLGVGDSAEVAGPMPSKAGSFVHADGWTLWRRARGHPLASPRAGAALGALAAGLHRRAQALGPVPDVDVEPALVRWARQHHPGAHAVVRGSWFVHGDLHARNVVVADGAPVAIDWVDAGAGTFEADLALTAVYAVDADPRRARRVLDETLAAYALAGGPGSVEGARALIGVIADLAAARSRYYGDDDVRGFAAAARVAT